jgi:hypothetical protein
MYAVIKYRAEGPFEDCTLIGQRQFVESQIETEAGAKHALDYTAERLVRDGSEIKWSDDETFAVIDSSDRVSAVYTITHV